MSSLGFSESGLGSVAEIFGFVTGRSGSASGYCIAIGIQEFLQIFYSGSFTANGEVAGRQKGSWNCRRSGSSSGSAQLGLQSLNLR